MLRTNQLIFVIHFLGQMDFTFQFASSIWLPNFNYENPESWENSKIPCANDNIAFPANFEAALLLPKNIKTQKIILPSDGFLIFDIESTTIEINSIARDDHDSSQCREKTNEIVKFKKPKPELYFSTRNWNKPWSAPNNPAIPHTERIPCDYEYDVYPGKNSFMVDMQNSALIGSKFTVFNNIRMGEDKFNSFLKTILGVTMFKNFDIDTKHYDPQCLYGFDCICHDSAKQNDIMELLCSTEKLYCPVPQCMNPIKPVGHCCYICGSTLIFNVVLEFVSSIEKIIIQTLEKDIAFKDKMFMHGSMVHGEERNFFQVVLVDKGAYSEISSKCAIKLKLELEQIYKCKYFVGVEVGLI